MRRILNQDIWNPGHLEFRTSRLCPNRTRPGGRENRRIAGIAKIDKNRMTGRPGDREIGRQEVKIIVSFVIRSGAPEEWL
jgi:hypothetical protein